MRFIVRVVLICSLACLLPVLPVQAVPDPTEQLRPFIGTIRELLVNPEQVPKNALVSQVMTVARTGFDFREMARRVLGSHWNMLNPTEQEAFVDLFTRLLEQVYVSQIDKYDGQTINFAGQRIKGTRAEVQTTVVDGAVVVNVSYILALNGGKWLIYDVVVEGVSLVRNYMDQFRDILRREGYPALVSRLEAKVTEMPPL